MPSLTDDQIQMLQMVIDGKYLKEVAHDLGKSTEAVKVTLFRARQRAGVETLYQLVAVSISFGWCVPPEPRRTS